MQPVLIDGGELMPQTAIEIFDDPCVAFHGPHPIICLRRTRAKFWNCSNLDQNARPDKGGRMPALPAKPAIRCRLLDVLAARTALASGGRQRLVHDPPDGARAPPALGAATEAAIDLAGRKRRLLGAERRAHVFVGQHVARTDDHGNPAFPTRYSSLCNDRYMR